MPKSIRHREFNQMQKNGSAQFKTFLGVIRRSVITLTQRQKMQILAILSFLRERTISITEAHLSHSNLQQNLKQNAEKGIENVFISSVVQNKKYIGYFLEQVNTQTANLCEENNYGFIDHSKTNSSHLYDNGWYLLESGKIILAKSIINCLDTFFHQPLSHPNRY